jgi:sulfate adenylyltransferase
LQLQLTPPHCGELNDLIVRSQRAADLQAESRNWISWDLTPRQLCDLELLLNGAFSPLRGFMTREDYDSVCSRMRLANGGLWPMPIMLDVSDEFADRLEHGTEVALRDPEGVMLAVLHVEDVWRPDRLAEAESVYGTTNSEHPGVNYLLSRTQPWFVGGRVEGIQLPTHYDFNSLRLTPAELRNEFERLDWPDVVAFQTRNPMHRAHFELTMRAVKETGAKLLVQPVVGMTKPGDVDHYTRIRCYQHIMEHYPRDTAKLSLLPLAMRMAGPREALWHAIIRKNYGCTHFIIGRDHAGPGKDSSGKPFYGPYDAQELLIRHEEELEIQAVPFQQMVFVERERSYFPQDQVPEGERVLDISGTELRQRLAAGGEIPEWFTFPEVADELRRTHPPRHKQGVTIFFTGLSGAGKSTIANALLVKLLEVGGRQVTLLDGDLVRKNLSSELGFSKEDRNTNIRRIGFVASEIVRNGGIAICAPIAPYDSIRREVRAMVNGNGFALIHVMTPLEVCEERDRKGLYAKARAGLIKEFTGISDPYEPPTDAELSIDTTMFTPEEAAQTIIEYLRENGYLN